MTILELLKENGIPTKVHGEHHHTTQNFVNVDCPFCSPRSNSFRMGISLDVRAASCWSCGRRRVFDVLVELVGLDKTGNFYKNLPPTTSYRTERATGILKMPQPNERSLIGVFQKYLNSRGFEDMDYLRRIWDLRSITIHPTHGWRLLIPIHFNNEIVSWTTRSISKLSKQRYISAKPEEESISHKRLLYGEDYCRHACIVTEGPLDVWKVGPGAVATFGTAVSISQVLRIAKYPVRVLLFDADAQDKARHLAQMLSCHPGETYVVELKSGDDPGSADPEELLELRRRFLE